MSGRLRHIRAMNSKPSLLPVFLVLLLAIGSAFGQTKIDLQSSDTMQTILEKQIGQTVEFRMRSGEKIGGKIEKLNDKLVHLSALTGADYFDGVVALDSIAAVVVRAKSK